MMRSSLEPCSDIRPASLPCFLPNVGALFLYGMRALLLFYMLKGFLGTATGMPMPSMGPTRRWST